MNGKVSFPAMQVNCEEGGILAQKSVKNEFKIEELLDLPPKKNMPCIQAFYPTMFWKSLHCLQLPMHTYTVIDLNLSSSEVTWTTW